LDAPQSALYPEPRMEALMVLFRIVSRVSWDELQSLHKAFSGSRVEHVLYGIYVLIILPGSARELAS
jgi:hypothetical protein